VKQVGEDLDEHFISMKRFARAVTRWPTRKTREFLQARGATELVGGRHYTTRDLIRQAFPRIYIALWAKLDADGDADDDE
jgi:hypothetical protein